MPTQTSKYRPNSYPFGSSLKTRGFSAASGFRFGFNTQEKDKKVYNNNETYTATFWEYDGSLGRRWNVDPKPIHSFSVYSVFANNPIWFIDRKGDSVELIIGKPYTDKNGKNHPYGHAALRVFNSKEGYNTVYDFGRYGSVDWSQITGEGILNVYSDASKYLNSEMKDRNSVGFSQGSTVEKDREILDYFKKMTDAGSVYKSGAVPNGGGTAYKLKTKYNIFNNNCLTKSNEGLKIIDIKWVEGQFDPRNALSTLESNYEELNLIRVEYLQGGKSK